MKTSAAKSPWKDLLGKENASERLLSLVLLSIGLTALIVCAALAWLGGKSHPAALSSAIFVLGVGAAFLFTAGYFLFFRVARRVSMRLSKNGVLPKRAAILTRSSFLAWCDSRGLQIEDVLTEFAASAS